MVETVSVGPADQGFLLEVFASTRQAELDAWGWDAAAREAFLQMQWRAQCTAYAGRYPDADHRIIRVDGQPAGRLLTVRREDALHLVDIALLPVFQGRGIGTALIRSLQQEAATAGKPLRLQVLKTNPARRLYLRLGFTALAEDDVYTLMEWRAMP